MFAQHHVFCCCYHSHLWNTPINNSWMTFRLKRLFFVGRFEAWHGLLYLLDGLLRVQGANIIFIFHVLFSEVRGRKLLC